MIKVLLAEDHQLVRDGIKRLLNEANDIQVVAEASDGLEAIKEFQVTRPDVVILDISMPLMDGLDVCKQLKASYPDTKIIILTVHPEEQYAVRALNAGAMGYLTKKVSAEELQEAIRNVAAGKLYLSDTGSEIIITRLLHQKSSSDVLEDLSDREVQVFNLLSQGKKLKEIAETLGLSVNTIDNYRNRILNKLNLKRTVDLVAFAHRNHLL